MAEPIILAGNEQHNRRLVQLAAWHEIDREGSLTLLYTASMTEGGVTIRRMCSNEPQEQFYLDIEVANAFVAAWTKFNDDLVARVKAENEHRAHLIAEAYDIVRQYPSVKIEELAPNCWRVSCPESGWITSHPAYDPESLLRDVKNAQADYLRHLPAIKARRSEQGGDAA